MVRQTFGRYTPWLLIGISVLKLVMTAFCLRFGMKGGHFFPLIFACVCMGFGLAMLVFRDPAEHVVFAAGVVTAAALGAQLKKPLAVSVLMLLCFPPRLLFWIFLAAAVSGRLAQFLNRNNPPARRAEENKTTTTPKHIKQERTYDEMKTKTISGAVLVGGGSKRMGTAKAEMKLGDLTLLEIQVQKLKKLGISGVDILGAVFAESVVSLCGNLRRHIFVREVNQPEGEVVNHMHRSAVNVQNYVVAVKAEFMYHYIKCPSGII